MGRSHYGEKTKKVPVEIFVISRHLLHIICIMLYIVYLIWGVGCLCKWNTCMDSISMSIALIWNLKMLIAGFCAGSPRWRRVGQVRAPSHIGKAEILACNIEFVPNPC